MADYTPRTPAEKLLEATRSTAIWLERFVEVPSLPKSQRELARSLRGYLNHCARRARKGNISVDDADRRLKRIAAAAFELIRENP